MKGEDIKAGSNFILSNNKGRMAPVVAAKVVMDIKLIPLQRQLKALLLATKQREIPQAS